MFLSYNAKTKMTRREQLDTPVSIVGAMICYNVGVSDPALAEFLPPVAVMLHKDPHWRISRHYRSSCGWCDVKGMRPMERQSVVLSTALGLIIREQFSPVDVHAAFWNIKEYRDGLPPDVKSPDGKTYACPEDPNGWGQLIRRAS